MFSFYTFHTFLKTENFDVSAVHRRKLNQMLIKIWGRIYYAWKKVGVQLLRRDQRYDNNKLRSLIINWDVWQKKWSKSLNCRLRKKRKQSKIAERQIPQVNNFLLLNFVLFFYKERVISKYLTLALAYVSITNNLKLTLTFWTMKSVIRKFQILIHNNNFRLGILF